MWSNVGCGFGQKNHYAAGVLQQHEISVVAANDQQYKLQNETNKNERQNAFLVRMHPHGFSCKKMLTLFQLGLVLGHMEAARVT